MGQLKIDILGTSLTLQAKEDDIYLSNLLKYYADICRQIEVQDNLTDQKKIAVLAGILIADELLKERAARDDVHHNDGDIISTDEAEVDRITQNLIEKINQALQ